VDEEPSAGGGPQVGGRGQDDGAVRSRARVRGWRVEHGPATTVVVIGVSGSGKTTVAEALAARTGWPFLEGDDVHPAANVAKMRAGRPLDDADRRPWLQELARRIDEHEAAGRSVVVTCSALKRAYRQTLADGHPSVVFVQVDVPRELLAQRMARRAGHYMPASLLQSQLDAFEPLQPDEPGVVLDGMASPDDVVARLLSALPRLE
jgi:gluconokinase